MAIFKARSGVYIGDIDSPGDPLGPRGLKKQLPRSADDPAAMVFALVVLVRDALSTVLHWIIGGATAIVTIPLGLHIPIPKPQGEACAILVLKAFGMTLAWLAVDR